MILQITNRFYYSIKSNIRVLDIHLFLLLFQIIRTINTFASLDVTVIGKYHVTVMAYNAALEPSSPVCSDGVTIDLTPPILEAVAVIGLWTKEGMAKDDDGQLWFINQHREKFPVTNNSHECL